MTANSSVHTVGHPLDDEHETPDYGTQRKSTSCRASRRQEESENGKVPHPLSKAPATVDPSPRRAAVKLSDGSPIHHAKMDQHRKKTGYDIPMQDQPKKVARKEAKQMWEPSEWEQKKVSFFREVCEKKKPKEKKKTMQSLTDSKKSSQ